MDRRAKYVFTILPKILLNPFSKNVYIKRGGGGVWTLLLSQKRNDNKKQTQEERKSYLKLKYFNTTELKGYNFGKPKL